MVIHAYRANAAPLAVPSLCHMSAPSLFAELEATELQYNRIVQLQLAPGSLTPVLPRPLPSQRSVAHGRLLLLLKAEIGTLAPDVYGASDAPSRTDN